MKVRHEVTKMVSGPFLTIGALEALIQELRSHYIPEDAILYIQSVDAEVRVIAIWETDIEGR